VYVLAPDLSALPAPSIAEDGMLDTTASPRHPNSRLSCQLFLDEPATLEIPPSQ
jgi:2Fe-2S ferredoxin